MVAPSLFWCALIAGIVWAFNQDFRDLLGRTTKFKGLGVEIEAAERRLEKTVAQVEKIPEQGAGLRLSRDDPLRASLVRRWAAMGMSERKLRILLLHDRPNVARALRVPFAELGFTVDIGICSREAESLLSRHLYDVVVSDINWKKCPGPELASDGVAFLRYAKEKGLNRPTVFYVENLRPENGTPPYAAGISNNWYEVLHFVLDVIARQDR